MSHNGDNLHQINDKRDTMMKVEGCAEAYWLCMDDGVLHMRRAK
jgi:hypothetical protein